MNVSKLLSHDEIYIDSDTSELLAVQLFTLKLRGISVWAVRKEIKGIPKNGPT